MNVAAKETSAWPALTKAASKRKNRKLWKRGMPFYMMILPGLLYFIVFRYLPMGGIAIAFQDYDPFDGFLKSDWVGMKHFVKLLHEPDIWMLLKNTLVLSLLNLIFFFPMPIVMAILLSEAGSAWFKKSVQTVIYMPHFLSWVVVAGITVMLFATQDGGVNKLLSAYGLQRIDVLTNSDMFRGVYVLQNIWKEAGWNAIIFLAALASVDPTLYEAAVMDGAGRWRQIWHITLPALKSTVVVLFILRLGHIMETGFEHIYLIQNTLNLNVSDVFDTYVYRTGITQMEYSYTTATGLFKSVVGLTLVVLANRFSKKMGEEGVY